MHQEGPIESQLGGEDCAPVERAVRLSRERTERGKVMSTHVHRDGAHKIIVQDGTGREVTLVSQDHTLQISTSGVGPRLTPQMAHDLADELHQWATCQQTVRGQGHRRPVPAESSDSSDGPEQASGAR